MKVLQTVVCFLLFICAVDGKPTNVNNRPIIAVLAQLTSQDVHYSYIAASYVKYLESAGARVVPVLKDLTPEDITKLFSHVNGVFFPGGGVSWYTSAYYKHAKQFYQLAVQANKRGDHFPMWGTCLGFEALSIITAGTKDILSPFKAVDVTLSLNYTSEAKKSRLFKNMPEWLYKAIGNEKLTYNHHKYGVSSKTYDTNRDLKRFFNVLSTNTDPDGNTFVSTIEGK